MRTELLKHYRHDVRGDVELEFFAIGDDGGIRCAIDGVAFIVVQTAEMVQVEGSSAMKTGSVFDLQFFLLLAGFCKDGR